MKPAVFLTHFAETFDLHREKRKTATSREVGTGLSDRCINSRRRRDHLVVVESCSDFSRRCSRGLAVSLPLPTRIVMALSNLIGSWFGFLFLVAIIKLGFRSEGMVWNPAEDSR